jgi:hypothetical protein
MACWWKYPGNRAKVKIDSMGVSLQAQFDKKNFGAD